MRLRGVAASDSCVNRGSSILGELDDDGDNLSDSSCSSVPSSLLNPENGIGDNDSDLEGGLFLLYSLGSVCSLGRGVDSMIRSEGGSVCELSCSANVCGVRA